MGTSANGHSSTTDDDRATATTQPALADGAVLHADRGYFDGHGAASGLDYPDPEPAPLAIPLLGDEVLIGRRSRSRGVDPQIDLSDEHEDPAASHRHAVLRRTPSGWTLTDLGSTNGTRLDPEGEPLPTGVPVPVVVGTRIYVGAWTCLTLGR